MLRLFCCLKGNASLHNGTPAGCSACARSGSEELMMASEGNVTQLNIQSGCHKQTEQFRFDIFSSNSSDASRQGDRHYSGPSSSPNSPSACTTATETDASRCSSSVIPSLPLHGSEYGSRPELEALIDSTILRRILKLAPSSEHLNPPEGVPRPRGGTSLAYPGTAYPATASEVQAGCQHPAVIAQSGLRFATLPDLVGSLSSAYWVGQGAQGTVIQAAWSPGCTVAVKWLVADAADLPAALLEALLAKMLSHPHVLRTFDCAVCKIHEDSDLSDREHHRMGGVAQRCGRPVPSLGCVGFAEPRTIAPLKVNASFDRGQTWSTPERPGAAPVHTTQGHRPVDCMDVLKQRGAGPGKFVVRIVSEWCDAGTLHAAIRRGMFRADGERSAMEALRALLRTAHEIAQALRHLHSLDLIHGDLKPGNVLLQSCRSDRRGFEAKLADFGLSRVLLSGMGQQQQQREDGQHAADSCCFVATDGAFGTVSYMAPEYLDNRLGTCSDVYSFGVLLWHMYTGRSPFADCRYEAQVAVGVLSGELALEWPAATPAPLLRLGQACCRREPAERPSVQEVLSALSHMEAHIHHLADTTAATAATAAAIDARAPATAPQHACHRPASLPSHAPHLGAGGGDCGAAALSGPRGGGSTGGGETAPFVFVEAASSSPSPSPSPSTSASTATAIAGPVGTEGWVPSPPPLPPPPLLPPSPPPPALLPGVACEGWQLLDCSSSSSEPLPHQHQHEHQQPQPTSLSLSSLSSRRAPSRRAVLRRRKQRQWSEWIARTEEEERSVSDLLASWSS